MDVKSIIAIVVLSFILALSLSWNFYQLSNPEMVIEKLEVRDTVRIDSIQIKEKTVVRYLSRFDTIIIHNTDTIMLNLPIEHKRYSDVISSDSISYQVDISYSGFKPSLDDVSIKTRFISPVVIKEKQSFWKNRFCITAGVYGGYSPIYNKLDVIVGVGGSIRIY